MTSAESNYPLLKSKQLSLPAAQQGKEIATKSYQPSLDAAYQLNLATNNKLLGSVANIITTWLKTTNLINPVKSSFLRTVTLGLFDPGSRVGASVIASNPEKRFVIRLKVGIAECVDVRNGIQQDKKMEIYSRTCRL